MSEAVPDEKPDPSNLPSGMCKTVSFLEQPAEHCNGEVFNTTGSKQKSIGMPKCDSNIHDECCVNPESDALKYDTNIQDTLLPVEEEGTESKMDCSENMEVLDTAENTQTSEFSLQDSKTLQKCEKEEANILLENVTLSDQLEPKVGPCDVRSEDQLIRKQQVATDDIDIINVSPKNDMTDLKITNVSPENYMTAEVLPLLAQKPIDEHLPQETPTGETKDAKEKPRKLSSVVPKVSTKTTPKNTANTLGNETQTNTPGHENESEQHVEQVLSYNTEDNAQAGTSHDCPSMSHTQGRQQPQQTSGHFVTLATPARSNQVEYVGGLGELEQQQDTAIINTGQHVIPPQHLCEQEHHTTTTEGEEEASLDEKEDEETGVEMALSFKEKQLDEEKIYPKRNRKLWSKEEDETLVDLVKKHGPNWSCIADKIKSRTSVQCRGRWLGNFAVNWSVLKWTAEEDELLDEAYARYGPDWKEIARLFPGRTVSGVMQHWRALPMKRKAQHVVQNAPPTKKAFVSSSGTSSGASSSTPAPKSAGVEHLLVLQANMDQQSKARFVNEVSKGVADYLRKALLQELVVRIPDHWVTRVSVDGAYAMMWAPGIHCAVQRAVYASFDASNLKIIVHSQVLKDDHEVYSNPILKPRVELTKNTVKDFAAVIVSALVAIQEYKLCLGIRDPSFAEVVCKYPMLRIDENLFDENLNETTVRVIDCAYLIKYRKKRCRQCLRYYMKIKKIRAAEMASGGAKESLVETAHNEGEVQNNLVAKLLETTHSEEVVRRDLVAKLVDTESLPVDKQLTRALEGAFAEAEGIVKLIWEEQNKANAAKKSPAAKWHPLALRWALKRIPAKPESRCIKVTPQRTLFEYYSEGVEDEVVKRMVSEVERFSDDFKKYIVVGFEEMCVFRNVVYHKTTGRIMGYVKLNEVDDEMEELEDELLEENVLSVTATSILTYFAKGVASEVRGVLACFKIEGALTENELHTKTWDVVRELETAKVKVIAIVGDGGVLCQAFFNRHTAFSDPASAVVYDTRNTYANDRPIFFFSDTRNLLKLIRNCFANSGAHKKTRLLMKKGEVITWKTIVDLFKAEGNKCPKLKGVHVFLNSHSVSEVFVAAQVMSRSVASCIEQSAIPGTTETVKFIRFVNDFYDCLNGASEKARNLNLAPYRVANDSRFVFLRTFLDYLEEWKVEVDSMVIPEAEKQKRKLSAQTLIGIERTVKAFTGVVKFLLEKRTDTNSFILARTFQLDDGL